MSIKMDCFLFNRSILYFLPRYGLAVVFPDTSPRGVNLPGEDESYDFGSGAGFYVNASNAPWSKHYKYIVHMVKVSKILKLFHLRMYDYITRELPELVAGLFPVNGEKMSITGHSMGGHGALICHLKNPGKYQSVSAFSPICRPTKCPWGEKAFKVWIATQPCPN